MAPSDAPPLSQREQMPGLLHLLDDPYGITWRVYNLLRRISLSRTARFLKGYARPPTYQKPVFILGAPRSGTTMLFQLLRASSHLAGLRGEGHDLWRMYHHPRYSGWDSDVITEGQVRRGEQRFVNAFFYAYVGHQRIVEKTPENSLRVPYLLDLFPDAHFVVIHRHPCDVINSLITGWRHPAGRYRSYFVPEDLSIPGYAPRRQWCFALIDGWRSFKAAPVPEIALAQWSQCITALHQTRRLVPPERWLAVHFEALLTRPAETARQIYDAIGIPAEAALDAKLDALIQHPVNALSAPGVEKWRQSTHAAEVESLLPRIAALAPQAGYTVNPETGHFELLPH